MSVVFPFIWFISFLFISFRCPYGLNNNKTMDNRKGNPMITPFQSTTQQNSIEDCSIFTI